MGELQSYGYTARVAPGTIEYSYRPLVDVTVASERQSRTFKALVDSGTDITVMDLTIARLLGISDQGKERGHLSGLEDWREGFLASVSLEIEKFPDTTLTFTVLFIENLSRNFDIILGQTDFFRNFNVTFKRAEEAFYLERI